MHPKLFITGVCIGYFILIRSPERGATTEVEKNYVDTVDIELINQWRNMDALRGTETGIMIQQVYTQVSRAVVASLQFYQSH